MREIQLRDAKASLSAVVDDAVRGEPAIITRHGKREAVLYPPRSFDAAGDARILLASRADRGALDHPHCGSKRRSSRRAVE